MVDVKLKPIKIGNEQFYYKVIGYYSEYGDYHETHFYTTNNNTKLAKKWKIFGISFGELVEKLDNKSVFTVNIDIESCGYTKSEVRKYVHKALSDWKELRNRCEEIENGEIL